MKDEKWSLLKEIFLAGFSCKGKVGWGKEEEGVKASSLF